VTVRLLALFLLTTCTGCSPNPCGDSPVIAPVGLDISGASNSPCTIVLTDGSSTLSYDIAPPSPVVTDTSLDARRPPALCTLSNASFAFDRSSSVLCFGGDDALNKLAHARNVGMCPLTLTLTCAGVTLYDHATWNFCNEQC
jgi:hypothetical protein